MIAIYRDCCDITPNNNDTTSGAGLDQALPEAGTHMTHEMSI